MKRIRVRPGKVVIVSDALVAKAAQSFGSVLLSREEVVAMIAMEPRGTTVFAGPTKPKLLRRLSRRG